MRGNLFAVGVDLVVLTVRLGELSVLLVRRVEQPHLGELALPGRFVGPREDLLDTATRELVEAGHASTGHHLEQLAGYAAPGRDPRGRVLSVGHLALVPDRPDPREDPHSDSTAAWYPVAGTTGLAFDHDRILADGVERARSTLEHTTAAAALCPPEFTVSQLRGVYEAVWGAPIDPRNFQRKVTGADGFLLPTATTTRGRGRPAQLFSRGPATTLYPPMLRQDPVTV